MTLPNRLTILRLFFVPLIVFFAIFPFGQFGISFGHFSIGFVSFPYLNLIILSLFSIASITDFFDGYLARKNNQVTSFGKFFDPIADKLLVNTVFIVLAVQGVIPVLAVLLMVWRDTLVEAVRMIAARNGVTVSAQFLGKAKTVAQMITIILYLLGNFPFELYHLPVSDLMLWFTVSVSILSGLSYFIQSKNLILESM